MVTFQLDKQEYQNDGAEIIRAFLGMAEIRFEQGWEEVPGLALRVDFLADPSRIRAQGRRELGVAAAEYIREIAPAPSPLLQKRQEKRALKIALFRVIRELFPEAALPWGSLTGIRPTKLFRELADELGEAEAYRMFTQDFDVYPEKASLAREIVAVQRPILVAQERELDVYLHIPFCRTRCLYCSFASDVVGERGVPEEYLAALYREIEEGARIVRDGGYRVRCAYVGGGTPTVLTAEQLTRLLHHAATCYGGLGRELTVEAGRPDTVSPGKLRALVESGVTRISLNPQTMNAATLTRIGRSHTPEDILRAYQEAREAGLTNINMDVIAGLPGENPGDMAATLERITALAPESLTVHTLAVKRSSKLKEQLEQTPLADAAEAERMTALGADCAASLGMRPYYMYRQKYMRGNLENVGYALPGKECLYNVDMMEEAVTILSHGAGAMTKRVFPGRDQRVERLPSPKDIATYLAKLPVLNEGKRALLLAD